MSFISTRKVVATMLPLVIAASAISPAVASAKTAGGTASLQACALLPDTKSSTRYTLFDAPYLTAAFKKAGVTAQVLNAQGTPQRQKSQAEAASRKGAKVILLDPLTPASGTAITARPSRRARRSSTTTASSSGSKASYYVSFDNVGVGKLQGKGLVAALKANGKYSQHP